jgi:hypothetical protein
MNNEELTTTLRNTVRTCQDKIIALHNTLEGVEAEEVPNTQVDRNAHEARLQAAETRVNANMQRLTTALQALAAIPLTNADVPNNNHRNVTPPKLPYYKSNATGALSMTDPMDWYSTAVRDLKASQAPVERWYDLLVAKLPTTLATWAA